MDQVVAAAIANQTTDTFGGIVQVRITGAPTWVRVRKDLAVTAGDIIKVTKLNGLWVAESVLYNVPPDLTPPTTPENLQLVDHSTSVDLSWWASTDAGSGVADYLVFRNGAQVATVATLTYTDPGLDPALAYQYVVRARDYAGNLSANSNVAARPGAGGGGVPEEPPPEEPPPPVTPPQSGTLVVSPVETRSWRPSGWRSDNSHVYQGQYGGNGNHIGCAFYGSAPRSLAGATVTSARAKVQRLYGGIYAGQTTTMHYLVPSTRPGAAPSPQGSAAGPTLAVSTSGTVSVPTAWAQAMVDGSAGGLCLYDSDGDPYTIYSGLADWAPAWQLTINWVRS